MFRVNHIALLGVVAVNSSCAHEVSRPLPPARIVTTTKVVERVVPKPLCPSDDRIRAMAVEASIASYRLRAVGSGACPCPDPRFTYRNGNRTVVCGSPEAGAIQPAREVMCKPSDVPLEVVSAMRSQIPECAQ